MNKLLSCRYNMDTNRVEAQFNDGTILSIDCIAVEDEYSNTPAQRAELDWLLYNNPLEYAQLVLSGEIEHYLSLSCDHSRFRGLTFNWNIQIKPTALYLQSLQIEGSWLVSSSTYYGNHLKIPILVFIF